jgi:ABC-type transport system involved in cytochrome bd biosynthesis fused ATPase/permease subunit
VSRISEFMSRHNAPSIASASTSGVSSSVKNADNIITITNGSFSWVGATPPKSVAKKQATAATTKPVTPVSIANKGNTGEFQLRGVNITASRGDLLTIVGSVGSGKSTLVDGIIGEATLVGGHMAAKGSIAYVAQQAWILNATVRENILFGKPWDEDYYNRVLDACALWPDLGIITPLPFPIIIVSLCMI